MKKMMEFCHVNESYEEYPKWKQQYEEEGFADFEMWNLDAVVCKMLADRLERYLEIAVESMEMKKKFIEDVEFCIAAFKAYAYNQYPLANDDLEPDTEIIKGFSSEEIRKEIEKEKKIRYNAAKAFRIFARIFPNFWL